MVQDLSGVIRTVVGHRRFLQKLNPLNELGVVSCLKVKTEHVDSKSDEANKPIAANLSQQLHVIVQSRVIYFYCLSMCLKSQNQRRKYSFICS